MIDNGDFIAQASSLRWKRPDELMALLWQPIETAPKDGTLIDLWGEGARYPDCKWRSGDYPGDTDEGWKQQYAENPGSFFSLRETPTHWMQPPTAPEQS